MTQANLAARPPGFAVAAMREALAAFSRQIEGFAMADAVTGRCRDDREETRISSALGISRGHDLESPTARSRPARLQGCAGGILSAAVDGLRAAEALTRTMHAGAGPVRAAG